MKRPITVRLSDETHTRLRDAQAKLAKASGIEPSLSDVAGLGLALGLPLVIDEKKAG